ncbi:helix-turn-helix domain-containing protein [Bacillus wiedmannii]|uniref:helix-turn-helix domain-containing protein n=1 Tax=Bacillus wiedmannii TaxID=1890302 RepID=UPI002E2429A4|nr:helix-turn-helix domain-containing protein [Bacillus wiedmannii]
MINFDEISRSDKRKFIKEHVLTTPEAIELLGISHSGMSNMIKSGKIVPIKKLGCVSLFLKSDLEKKKEELIVLRKKYQPNA